MDEIAVFVGSSKETELAYCVLEKSIQSYGNYKVYDLSKFDIELNNETSSATPFSLARMFVPLIDTDERYRIYVDSDMFVFADIQELVSSCENGTTGVYSIDWPTDYRQFSVMLFDMHKVNLGKYKEQVELVDGSQCSLSNLHKILDVEEIIPEQWNCLDLIQRDTKLVHFTFMPTQPWIYKNSRYASWFSERVYELLCEEKENTERLLTDGVAKGYISSHLITQKIREKIPNASLKKPIIFIPYWLEYKFKGINKILVKVIRAITLGIKVDA